MTAITVVGEIDGTGLIVEGLAAGGGGQGGG